MKRSLKTISIIALALGTLVFMAGNAIAKKGEQGMPPGQAKKHHTNFEHGQGHHDAHLASTTPPGWSHGKKTGWRGMPYPPGWSKWNSEQQTAWETNRNHALDEIAALANNYKIPTANVDAITQAFGQAVAGGIVINDARKKLVNALQDEGERKKLLINTSQNVLELLK